MAIFNSYLYVYQRVSTLGWDHSFPSGPQKLTPSGTAAGPRHPWSVVRCPTFGRNNLSLVFLGETVTGFDDVWCRANLQTYTKRYNFKKKIWCLVWCKWYNYYLIFQSCARVQEGKIQGLSINWLEVCTPEFSSPSAPPYYTSSNHPPKKNVAQQPSILRWAMGLTNWLVTGDITLWYNPLYPNYNPFTN